METKLTREAIEVYQEGELLKTHALTDLNNINWNNHKIGFIFDDNILFFTDYTNAYSLTITECEKVSFITFDSARLLIPHQHGLVNFRKSLDSSEFIRMHFAFFLYQYIKKFHSKIG